MDRKYREIKSQNTELNIHRGIRKERKSSNEVLELPGQAIALMSVLDVFGDTGMAYNRCRLMAGTMEAELVQ